MNSTLPLRKVRDFGEKVSETMRFIRVHLKDLLVLYGIFVLPFLLVAVYFGAGFFMDALTQISGNLDTVRAQWKIILAMVLIFFAVNAMATSIYIYMKLLDTRGHAPSIGDVARHMPRPLLTNFLYTLLMMACMALVMVPFILMFAGKGGGMVFTALFLFFAMIGLMLLTPYFILVYPCNTIGGSELGGGLRAPLRLLKGNWWSSLGYILVVFLIFYILSFVVQLVLTMILGMVTLFKANDGMQDFGKGMGVVYGLTMLVQQLFYIIVFVGAGLLYFSLHEEKVGTSLEGRIDELGHDLKQGSQQGEY